MKKVIVSLLFVVSFMFPAKTHAAGAAASAAIMANDWAIELEQFGLWATQALQMKAEIEHLFNQLEHMKSATKRALNNLEGILSVRSLGDFMGWFDRQLYLEREVERRYGNLDVTIGGKSFHVSEIDRIPDALKSNYVDKWGKELSEAEKKKIWADLGLSPGNYMYLQTWKERSQKISQKVRTLNDVFYGELDEAAARNSELMGKFAAVDDKLDINEISKDQAALLAQIEMAVREGNIITNNLAELILDLDRENGGAFLYSPEPLAGSSVVFLPILGSGPDVEIETYGTPFPGRR